MGSFIIRLLITDALATDEFAMNPHSPIRKSLLSNVAFVFCALFAAMLLSACGGSGSGNSDDPPTDTIPHLHLDGANILDHNNQALTLRGLPSNPNCQMSTHQRPCCTNIGSGIMPIELKFSGIVLCKQADWNEDNQ